MLKEIKNKRLLRESLESLKDAINKSKVYSPTNVSKFVFLCGANKDKFQISERRQALMDFAARSLPDSEFFLAEKTFITLNEEGHKGNILDVEHLISDFADYIIIILESPSAFAELGAFSNNTLRQKLIVINDKQYVGSGSFINLGPLKAIEEASGKDRLIYYRMSQDGVYIRDAIGRTFSQIYRILNKPTKSRRTSLDVMDCDPSSKADKNKAMFIHDLVKITGPILYKELVEILILIFGDKEFDEVKHILAILTSFQSLERNKNGLYKSLRTSTYFEFRFDVDKVISVFRNYMLSKYPERFYEY